jgi:hypothetical protein
MLPRWLVTKTNPETIRKPGRNQGRIATALATVALHEGARVQPPEHAWSEPTIIPPDKRITAKVERKGLSREAITALEQLSTPITSQQKAEILLAGLGSKPAALMGLLSPIWHLGELPQSVSEHDYAATTDALTGLGMHVRAMDATIDCKDWSSNPPQSAKQAWRVLLASQSDAMLEQISSAHDSQSPEANRLLGAALGYPPTAVEAYIAGHSIRPQESGEGDPAVLAMASFRLSPEHAQEELAVVRSWTEQVQNASPAIYQQLVDHQTSLLNR